ncbi:MAG: DMT family transporter, partial [Phycisphaerae bacterium]|nr:DMT family transporter [Phycisphaerae bacterium]
GVGRRQGDQHCRGVAGVAPRMSRTPTFAALDRAAIVPAMSTDTFGQLCALLAALTWAMALVLFKQSGERVPPIALCLFKNVVAIILLGITVAVQPGLIRMELISEAEMLRQITPREIWLLSVSGIVGIAAADTLFFYSLNRIGVGIIVVLDCVYTPAVIFLAWWLWGERLMPLHYVGAVLILASILVSTRHKVPANRTRREMLLGIFAGILAIVAMAWAIVYIKPILQRQPVMWTALIRMAAGTAALALFAIVSIDRRATMAAFKPAAIWRKSIPAAVLGTYLALVFWIAGFKYTDASLAAILNQTSIVFAIILAAIFLKEPLDRRKITAVALGGCGFVIVTLAPTLQVWLDGLWR